MVHAVLLWNVFVDPDFPHSLKASHHSVQLDLTVQGYVQFPGPTLFQFHKLPMPLLLL